MRRNPNGYLAEEARLAKAAARASLRTADHNRRKERALIAMLDHPRGSTGADGVAKEPELRALVVRGLAERRWVLTAEGECLAKQLKEAR